MPATSAGMTAVCAAAFIAMTPCCHRPRRRAIQSCARMSDGCPAFAGHDKQRRVFTQSSAVPILHSARARTCSAKHHRRDFLSLSRPGCPVRGWLPPSCSRRKQCGGAERRQAQFSQVREHSMECDLHRNPRRVFHFKKHAASRRSTCGFLRFWAAFHTSLLAALTWHPRVMGRPRPPRSRTATDRARRAAQLNGCHGRSSRTPTASQNTSTRLIIPAPPYPARPIDRVTGTTPPLDEVMLICPMIGSLSRSGR